VGGVQGDEDKRGEYRCAVMSRASGKDTLRGVIDYDNETVDDDVRKCRGTWRRRAGTRNVPRRKPTVGKCDEGISCITIYG
jgi:hypothetical protein